MTIDLLKRFLQFCLFVLVQALILNRILLFGCAMPLLYVYFVILFPRNYPKWGVLLWSFAMGLAIDMFSNTPGIGSASLTLIGALQPQVLELCLPREADEDLEPSLRTLGTSKFVFFAFTLTAIFCITFFTLEAFTFFNWLQWLLCIGGSLLLTFLLIITLESIRK